MDVVFWIGPTPSPLDHVRWLRPTRVVRVASGIGGTDGGAFRALAAGLEPHALSTLAARDGIHLRHAAGLALLAYGPGGQFLDRVLRFDRERESIGVVASFDAYPSPPSRAQGHRWACERAARGAIACVVTTSYPAAGACLSPLLCRLGPLSAERLPPAISPPISCLGAGRLTIARYGARLAPLEHATRLAPQFCSALLAFALAGEPVPDGGL